MARTKSFDEAAVLDQALQLFWERGYEGTSLADLETHLGLGRQSLYNSFGDKHALFLKALERYRRRVSDPALAQLNSPEAGFDTIRQFFGRGVQAFTSDTRRGCLVANTISELGSGDGDALVRCNHSREDMERAFRNALTRAKARRELPKTLDVEATAMLLVIQNYGLTLLAKAGATATQLHAAVEALLAGLK
ncbi:MAG TPA: TetR/AcrR family transcriptional regulator [Gemmatimonadales bacterium]|nr:TetR/AcrR family transcriptional regulator [Gemmatimonadales bacterium]